MSSKVKVNRISRGHVRGRITRLADEVSSSIDSFSRLKITQSIALLKEYAKKLKIINIVY